MVASKVDNSLSERVHPRDMNAGVERETMSERPAGSKYDRRIVMMEERKHVLEKPALYIGSIKPLLDTFPVLEEEGSITWRKFEVAPGLERIYLEIVSNAIDQVLLARREYPSSSTEYSIDIEVTKDTIKVKNTGLPMMLEFNKKLGMYSPEMAFGHMRTSSNYEGSRKGAGTNGIGGKAANIFSKLMFNVKIVNMESMQVYEQTWKDYMGNLTKPLIRSIAGDKEYEGQLSSVTITFKPDLELFSESELHEDIMCLFRRHALDASLNTNIDSPSMGGSCQVTFNGEALEKIKIESYVSRFCGEKIASEAIYGKVRDKSGDVQIVYAVVDRGLKSKKECYRDISFVNGMQTKNGGVHVKGVKKSISDFVCKKINKQIERQLKKNKPGISSAEMRPYTINLSHVRDNITVFLSCFLEDPEFESQAKTSLVYPKIKFNMSAKQLKMLETWNLIDRLMMDAVRKWDSIENRSSKKKKKTDVLRTIKGRHANYARSNNPDLRAQATLYVVEGDSAANLVVAMIPAIPNGCNIVGYLPMRGKSMNVMKAGPLKTSREMLELMEMLGLEDGVDYSDEKAMRKLRYGRVVIMADSDNDGKHIEALLMNFFHCRFPSLLGKGFVYSYLTPSIKARKGKKVERFYNRAEFDEWMKGDGAQGKWKIKYYKGLGTFTRSEPKEDYPYNMMIENYVDSDTQDALQLAFGADRANDRKNWILDMKNSSHLPTHDGERRPISRFIREEVVEYSQASLERCIPAAMDGLKDCQRKCIEGAVEYWKVYKRGPFSFDTGEKKVSQFGCFVSERNAYQHGESILYESIIKMAQNFVGRNNLPLFDDVGQYGSRMRNGKDAGDARYIYTRPTPIFPYIFRYEDRKLLEFLKSEHGKEVEPKRFYPVIPMLLVNGAEGVATGWCTFIPKHNPRDIIEWIRKRISSDISGSSEIPSAPHPWYQGFGGDIHIFGRDNLRRLRNDSKYKRMAHKIDEDASAASELSDTSDVSLLSDGSKETLTMCTRGKYMFDKKIIHVYELPIGEATQKYVQRLEQLQHEGKISSFDDFNEESIVNMKIHGFGMAINYKNLGLQASYGLGNMTALDEDNTPVVFERTLDILEDFYKKRLPIYARRKVEMLEKITKKQRALREKIEVVTAIVEKTLDVMDRPLLEIKQDVLSMNLNWNIFEGLKAATCSMESIEEMRNELQKHTKNAEDLAGKTPHDLWIGDLDDLEGALDKFWKPEKPSSKPTGKDLC